jgi:regulator of sigma E protease
MLGVLGQIVTYVLPFLVVLTTVVTIHELGHFWMARAFGVKIERFSIGFGRPLFQRTDRHGIQWRIGWLPLGGYVRFAGDTDASSLPDRAGLDRLRQQLAVEHGPGAERDYFHFKPVWQRALIVAAGPLSNFVLAIVIFTLMFSILGQQTMPPRVGAVTPGGPAAEAGFQTNDVITAVNGRRVTQPQDVVRVVTLSSDTPVRFDIERNGQPMQLVGTPRRTTTQDPIAGEARIGRIGMELGYRPSEVRFVRYNPIEAVGAGVSQTGAVLSTTMTYVGRVVTGRESGDMLSGPLGIARATGGVTKQAQAQTEDLGLKAANVVLMLAQLAAILSIGIGFLNLLPIPILDGGHLVFYAYEAVARRPVAARVQEAGYRVGLALLAGLMLFATWNDLQKLNLFKFLGGLVS